VKSKRIYSTLVTKKAALGPNLNESSSLVGKYQVRQRWGK